MTQDDNREDALLEAEWALEYGNVERASANYQKALELYFQAIEVFQKNGHRHGEGRAVGQAAGVLLVQDQLEEALRYYRKALSIHQETGNKRQQGQVLGEIRADLRDSHLRQQSGEEDASSH